MIFTPDHLSPDMTAQQMADLIAAKHEDFYRQMPKGQLLQTAILEKPDSHYEVLLCPWSCQEERAIVLIMLRVTIAALKVQRYAFFSEVWKSSGPAEAGVPLTRPSEDPNRVEEVFTVVADRRLAEPVVIAQQIIRGRSGGVRKLLRRDMDGLTGVAGDLTDLFPQGPVQ